MTRPTGFVCVCCCFFEMLSLLIFWSNVLLLGICFSEAHLINNDDAYRFFLCMLLFFQNVVSVDFLIKCVASWNMLPFWEAHPKNDDDAYWFCVCMSVYTWLSVYLCWCVISQCCLLKDHVDFLIKCVAYWNLLPFWEAHPKNDDDAYRFCVCMSVCAAALATPLPTFSFQWSTLAWCCMYNSA